MKRLLEISGIVIIWIGLTIFCFSCKKGPTLPSLTTTTVSEITQETASSGGNVTDDGGEEVTARGVCWSTTQNPTTGTNKTTDGSGTGIFTSNLTGLTAGTEYYVRAYATNSEGTAYGNQVFFTTLPINLPTLTTDPVTSITQTTAVSGGNITDDGGAAVTARGVCWSTSTDPTTADNTTTDGSGTGVFTSNLTGLSPNTYYYVRAYAVNTEGTAYGNEVTFTTVAIQLPTVITSAVSSITPTTALSGGNVTDDGGGTVSARGVCWSTSNNPTTSDNNTSDGTGTGTFTSNLTGLSPGTVYYVRAYASNEAGTAYGNEVTFTSLVQLPVVTTTPAGSITTTSAVTGGNVLSDGGAPVTTRGVCWSANTNPTTADNTMSSGSGTGVFISSLTSLSPGTLYYVRAYATNSAGTAYGNQISFFTRVQLPVLNTIPVTSVTATSAVSGGNITDNGGGTITARGVCWSINENPTITDSHTDDGTGIGDFISNITGLNPNTNYFVRAYATNEEGAAYGNEVSFMTEQLTDADGNIYSTVNIGTQLWMAENLKTTKYNDGTDIPLVTDNTEWSDLNTPGYCWYNNDMGTYGDTYGALYNWYAVNTGILCPDGWHVPADEEWTTLIDYLGGESIAGGKLKEEGIIHWESPNTGATNESGFTALPGGYRSNMGFFVLIGTNGILWSSTPYQSNNGRNCGLTHNSSSVYQGSAMKIYGFSVRCIAD